MPNTSVDLFGHSVLDACNLPYLELLDYDDNAVTN